MSTDELRRTIEALPGHKDMTYYHRWAAGMVAVSLERATFTQSDLDTVMGTVEQSVTEPVFSVGDQVQEIDREVSQASPIVLDKTSTNSCAQSSAQLSL